MLVLLKLLFSNRSEVKLESKKYVRGMTGHAILPPPLPLHLGRQKIQEGRLAAGGSVQTGVPRLGLAKEVGHREISESWQGVCPEGAAELVVDRDSSSDFSLGLDQCGRRSLLVLVITVPCMQMAWLLSSTSIHDCSPA